MLEEGINFYDASEESDRKKAEGDIYILAIIQGIQLWS